MRLQTPGLVSLSEAKRVSVAVQTLVCSHCHMSLFPSFLLSFPMSLISLPYTSFSTLSRPL